MTLWVCQGCPTRFAVGLLACPHCGSTDHYEEGSVMPKITVHGGPSIAGEPPNEPELVMVGETGPEPVRLPEGTVVVSVSVDGVDQGPGVVDETLGGDFKPLPEAVEGDTTEHVSEPDYENWTVAQLREQLADRKLPVSGKHAELVARLRAHDEP